MRAGEKKSLWKRFWKREVERAGGGSEIGVDQARSGTPNIIGGLGVGSGSEPAPGPGIGMVPERKAGGGLCVRLGPYQSVPRRFIMPSQAQSDIFQYSSHLPPRQSRLLAPLHDDSR